LFHVYRNCGLRVIHYKFTCFNTVVMLRHNFFLRFRRYCLLLFYFTSTLGPMTIELC
jgi:hypothetical protein